MSRTTTPSSRAIWLGGPQQAYRAGIIYQLAASVVVGDVIRYTADCEGSIYNYAYPDMSVIYPFSMFQTSAVVIFPPGVRPPDVVALGQFPFGGTAVSEPQGTDIGYSIPNYYYPVSRSGAFQATQSGSYTVVLYMWGGTDDPRVGIGNAATVYPRDGRTGAPSSMLTVTVN